MFKRIVGLFQKSYIAAFYDFFLAGAPRWPSRDFKTLAEDGYKANPTVYACINAVAMAVGGIPWIVTRRRGDRAVRLAQHPLLSLIRRPNPSQSWSDLTDWDARDYNLAGNSYAVLIDAVDFFKGNEAEPIRRPPQAIWMVQPGTLKAVPNKLGMLDHWVLQAPGLGGTFSSDRKLHPSRVIHRRTYNPIDRFYGLSPLEAAARDTDTMNVGLGYNYKILSNGGRPDGMLIYKGKLQPQAKQQAQADIDASFNDPEKAGRWKLLESYGNEVEVKPLGGMPKDMEFKEQRLQSALGICSVFGVPPEIIGIPNSKTYANYKEARLAFYLETVLPHLDRFKESYNRSLSPLYGDDIVLDYDRESIEAIQEDEDDRHARARENMDRGLWTPNEAREYVGSPRATDELADERLVPLGVSPASDFLTEPEPLDEPLEPEEEPVGEPSDGEEGKKSASAIQSLLMVKAVDGATAFKAFDSKRHRYERAMARVFAVPLGDSWKAAAQAISGMESPDSTALMSAVKHAVASSTSKWQEAYAKTYSTVGMDFALAVDAGLEEEYGDPAKHAGKLTLREGFGPHRMKADEMRDRWKAKIARYLRTEGGTKISQVQRTTRDDIMRVLATGTRKGEGADLLAARVAKAGKLQGWRALAIARTEVIGASNLGSQAAAEAFRVALRKSWLATTTDDRTRDTHLDAGGQTVGLQELFVVGSSQLEFPGDSSHGADAGELVNCRCTQVYEPA